MRCWKRILCLILAISILIPMMPIDTLASNYFTDMVGHWAAEYVDELYEMNVIKLPNDGEYSPEYSINVGDFSSMLDKYYFNGFTRSPYNSLKFLKEEGIVPSSLRQYSNITREEAVRLVVQCISGVEDELESLNYMPLDFTDSTSISKDYWAHVNFSIANGVLNGYPEGDFRPKQKITRAEAAKILFTVQHGHVIKEIESTEPDHPSEVKARLEVKPIGGEIVWNYRDYENNVPQNKMIQFDASKSTSYHPWWSFEFKWGQDPENLDSEVTAFSIYNKEMILYPNMFKADRSMLMFGWVTVMDNRYVEDTAFNLTDLYATVVNAKPNAHFTHSDRNYATLPLSVVNKSTDPEGDMRNVKWKITNALGDILFSYNKDLKTNIVNENFVEEYIESVNINETGGNITFKYEGYYKFEIEVIDDGGSYGTKKDAYSKTIYVNKEPTPPEANFEMREVAFLNEGVSIVDSSTDVNDDIVQWIWTKPSVNKDTNSPAIVSGSLVNAGGTLHFKEVGTYDVTLKVIDYTGFESSITKEVTIIPPIPVAQISTEGALKENRKVVIHSRDSINPNVDPIDVKRNIWTITPLDGQDIDGIKIDTSNTNLEERNVLFKEKGRYEVYLKVHNNFLDANQDHPNIGFSEITQIITIEEDMLPIPDFEIEGAEPNFFDNPVSTNVSIKGLAHSLDADIIDSYHYVVYRDLNENGDFSDDGVYATFDTKDADLTVVFEEGISGLFKVDLEVIEEFGQETIDKFVGPSDRRKAIGSKIFSVNWIPDIEFDIPEWKYTDDVIDISTTLKDENIGTLNVKWDIKRADETNIETMLEDNIDERAEYILENNGGLIRFKDSGYYELYATVTDEIGQSYVFGKEIRIYPLPEAMISDGLSFEDIEFRTKENRKYLLDGKSSYAHDYYGAEMHEIDHSKDYWEIVPLEGQNTNEVIKIVDGVGALANENSSNNKFIVSNNEFDETLLFKEKGEYLLRYKITNTFGKESPFKEQIITVAEDTPPVLDFKVINPTYRSPELNKNAKAVLYDISTNSTDRDRFSVSEMRYRFDSDNDGSFEGHEWSNIIPIDSEKQRAEVNLTHVGKYQFQFFVKDEFGQETIDEFVTSGDRRETYIYRVIEVDNVKPIAEFSINEKRKVDIVFTVGAFDYGKLKNLEEDIQINIVNRLRAENIDANVVIDTFQRDFTVLEISMDDYFQTHLVAANYGQGHVNAVGISMADFNSNKNNILNKLDEYDMLLVGFADAYSQYVDFNIASRDKVKQYIEAGGGVLFTHDVMGLGYDSNKNLYYFNDYLYKTELGIGGGAGSVSNNKICKVKSGLITEYPYMLPDEIDILNSHTQWSIPRDDTDIWFRFVNNTGNPSVTNHPRNHYIMTNDNVAFNSSGHVRDLGNAPEWEQKLLINTIYYVARFKLPPNSLGEMLQKPTWRDNSLRFVLNLNNVQMKELDDNRFSLLTRLLGQSINFSVLGTNENKNQSTKFIEENDNNGIFINNANFEGSLSAYSDYIVSQIKEESQTNIKYVLLDEEINYEIMYEDYEEDTTMPETNGWKYEHDYHYFENDLGRVGYSDIWLNDSKKIFNKVGRFTTSYRVKDNPVGSDERFDNYRKYSEMSDGKLDIFVHRKPVAQFTPTVNWSGAGFTIDYAESSYDIDHESLIDGYYKFEGSNIVSADSDTGTHIYDGGIVEKKWEHRVVGEEKWTIGQLTSGDVTKDYQVRLTVRDMDGVDFLGAWSDPKVVSITKKPQPPMAQFTLEPRTLKYNPVDRFVYDTLRIQDNSYDPNGDPINGWRWKLYKDNVLIGQYAYQDPQSDVNAQVKNKGLGNYKLTLQVKDNTGNWSNPLSVSEVFTQTFRVILANNEPIINWKVNGIDGPVPNPIHEALENINWNVSVSDPDNHPINIGWTLERYPVKNISDMEGYVGGTSTYNYTSNLPFEGTFKDNNRPWGAYRVALVVTDSPPVPPYEEDDAITVYETRNLYVIPDIKFYNVWYEPADEEIIVGDTIDLRARTSEGVTNVDVELGGEVFTLSKLSESEGVIEWSGEVVVPDTIIESGDYKIVYTATTDYGGVTPWNITRTITKELDVEIIALKLSDFRITNIVNQKEFLYPIRRDKLPLNYKTGYQITFEVNAKGNPSSVVASFKKNGVNDKNINLIHARNEGTETVYQGTYYADALSLEGANIYIDLIAYRDTNSYNYNLKENWDGHILNIKGTALQDGRINLTN